MVTDTQENKLLYRQNAEGDVYITPENYFTGSQFCIKPTKFELEKGILFAGHRFLPFCAINKPPIKTDLLWNDNKIARTEITMPFEDAITYYALFGFKQMAYIIPEEGGKLEMPDPDNLQMDATFIVYDMKEFYKDNKVKKGDILIGTVQDYTNQTIKIEHFPAKGLFEKVGIISEWKKRFEIEITHISSYLTPLKMTIEKELANALFVEDNFMIKNPYVNIGAALDDADSLELTEFMGCGIIWPKDEDIYEHLSMEDMPDDFGVEDDFLNHVEEPYELTELEDLVKTMGLELTEGEIEAYMRDELFHKGDSLESIRDAMFVGGREKNLKKYFPEEYKEFSDLLTDKFKQVQADYNFFRDAKMGKVRHELFAIKEEHLRFMRRLDANFVMPDDLPMDEIFSLADVMIQVGLLLEGLNDDEEITKKELKELPKMIAMLNPMVTKMIKSIEDSI
ncbi:MAG: hypothetical protein U9O87_00055 [Verrucomicrobiota bacterium]|nr:hypothetical protein [Verrucomicrobiota bacterium]